MMIGKSLRNNPYDNHRIAATKVMANIGNDTSLVFLF